ncbi:MAG TPA: respiratory nitrate reductase subunit gamma [Casimicrobiaceae bacterium]|nr:respiratory nitrate reductase subunit gamma [Casimicrobiaceae bacterium]
MDPVTMAFALALYAASLLFLAGLGYRVVLYARTPAPLRIPTMPAPIDTSGVAWRMTREAALFESLFASNKWTWLFGWTFHAAFVLVLLRHLRYFTQPVWPLVAWLSPLGVYAGFMMVAALVALGARRVVIERVRYVSTPSDHLMLVLLLLIAGTGLAMKYVAHTDIVALKAFVLGVMYFDWQPLPADPLLLVHLALVALLLAVFPVSKLLHAPGLFFSPTRNQVDDSRERRYVAPWAAALDK